MSSITSLTNVSQALTAVLAAIPEPIRTPNPPALESIITQNNLVLAQIDQGNKMEPKLNLKSLKIKEFFKAIWKCIPFDVSRFGFFTAAPS